MMSIFSDWLKSPISIVYIIYIDSFFEHRLSMGTPFHHWFNTAFSQYLMAIDFGVYLIFKQTQGILFGVNPCLL